MMNEAVMICLYFCFAVFIIISVLTLFRGKIEEIQLHQSRATSHDLPLTLAICGISAETTFLFLSPPLLRPINACMRCSIHRICFSSRLPYFLIFFFCMRVAVALRAFFLSDAVDFFLSCAHLWFTGSESSLRLLSLSLSLFIRIPVAHKDLGFSPHLLFFFVLILTCGLLYHVAPRFFVLSEGFDV